MGNLLQFWQCINSCWRQWVMGFQSVHVFTAKWTCSVIRTGGISGRKFPVVVDSRQPRCLKGISGLWRRANLLSSPKMSTCYWRDGGTGICYALCTWNLTQSLKKPSTATSTATMLMCLGHNKDQCRSYEAPRGAMWEQWTGLLM